ncbi:hypothetical protein BLNAU_16966 [Blattamonas nauphoetae]|uniref:Uncharacterized protein n=1 Tax=Blattamonas nauphoetae TaxID=2049346 RepID=A0ABQ9WQ29_9EUKA|nr:hypothetical protein BLNAU_23841 [Blattamonas nauphoetae]KAK2942933.1 hypothetical protein BLNAU_22144 [Blattamonas nauphoetae]KAK2942939.1 hypothetical protein BLNAU_22150 [Blattamonas nauphoetae]KAK2943175.1 hypothetical protein BLNAU_21903 [Blattamonas nauphoetae]KAK2945803.1 hypothetical protein BLNAU_19291 [Blattamonas nauphoetae]
MQLRHSSIKSSRFCAFILAHFGHVEDLVHPVNNWIFGVHILPANRRVGNIHNFQNDLQKLEAIGNVESGDEDIHTASLEAVSYAEWGEGGEGGVCAEFGWRSGHLVESVEEYIERDTSR